jgi:hypothetical protein
VLANIVSTPIITLWTTPAAAAAAMAAPVGLDEPFLALMGVSLDLVLIIARWSVEMSPEIDMPRMGSAGMALSALGIAVFCLANRRGRAFAMAAILAATVFWFRDPQPVGYVANDGSVFLKAEQGWLELTDWRADNGLNPLIIGDDIRKGPCSGKGLACRIDTPAGQFAVAPDVAPPPAPGAPCKTAAALIFTSRERGSAAINPCAYSGHGGAVLELSGRWLGIRTAQMQSGRAWTQPLYEKPPKRDRAQ